MGCCCLLVPVFVLVLVQVELYGFVQCQLPKVVNIAAVFSFDSVIGRSAKTAIQAAIYDINNDPSILRGIRLNPIIKDSNCSVFTGAVEVFQVVEQEVVAIIGPQSSSIARMISFIANGLQIPLISFAATDPTLSALQFPYFLRTTLSDSSQMAAMADLINYYEWHEVIAIFVDDDYGRNGISDLEDRLSKKMKKISYKLPLPVKVNQSYISDMLGKSKVIGPRVYVVHVNPDSGRAILSMANQLKMMTSGYVWLATEWLSASVDSSILVNQTSFQMLSGAIGLRQHVWESDQKKEFVLKKKKLMKEGLVSHEMNNYGLYAYDTMWTVAHALDKLLKHNGNITFSFDKSLHGLKESSLQKTELKTFDNGSLLLEKLMQTNFKGLTGQVQFDLFRNRVGAAYDVINIGKDVVHTIGYWSNNSGLSVLPPENLTRELESTSRVNPELRTATWPGGQKDKPRGWVVATSERPLRIGIPNRSSFVDFVRELNGTHEIQGYCIDVFNATIGLLPYSVPYRLEAFGDGKSNPSYDELVKLVAEDVFDAAVGDIAITTRRAKIVDFTQPYAADGLVVVTPNRKNKSSAWVFVKPFTVQMWIVTIAFFIFFGIVVWILEHRINDDFRGPPRQQLITVFLFSLSTLFKTNQVDTISTLGKMVMMAWLFLLMVITSSYTASLTSILTVEQLSSPITGIDSLISSNQPIGCQAGTFVQSYLQESLDIPQGRLVPLQNGEDYARALRLGPKNGGVAAIVDELPYVECFLSKFDDFGIVGRMISNSGWGFAFKRGSPLAVALSSAILKLSESGELQKINKKWFCEDDCELHQRHVSDPNQLHISSFWGLFLVCGIATFTALVIFLVKAACQFARYKKTQRELSSHTSSVQSTTGCAQAIYHFMDFLDEKEEAIKKIFKQYDNSQSAER
ncbi:hypothetical protein Sjap_003241 [Stephania japonica]|uniref:Glutamate receptor n=1 Tax=Stephania japonica TaxID=461633 RepID=A0AAP0KNJ3_9MAGN